MHFESALNCAWLFLGVLALGGTVRAFRRDAARRSRFSAPLQLIGISAVVLALFPYISATDDVVRIANAIPQSSESGPRSSTSDLVRLYEAVDSAVVTPVSALVVSFVSLGIVTLFFVRFESTIVPLTFGRSPPSLQSV